MGGFASRQESKSKKKRRGEIRGTPRFLILGRAGSGKSSILYKLKHDKFMDDHYHYFSSEMELINHDGVEYNAWILGGRCQNRVLFRFIITVNVGYIFIIDSTNVEEIDEAVDNLNQFILQREDFEGSLVMILANKQDLEGAVGPEVIESKIKNKCTLTMGNPLFVMPCSVTSGDSVQIAFNHFIKLSKINAEKKLQPGLIPQAWQSAKQETMTQGTANEEKAVEETPSEEKAGGETANEEKAVVETANEKKVESETTWEEEKENYKPEISQSEKGDCSKIVHKIKKSVFTNPFKALKSFLFY